MDTNGEMRAPETDEPIVAGPFESVGVDLQCFAGGVGRRKLSSRRKERRR